MFQANLLKSSLFESMPFFFIMGHFNNAEWRACRLLLLLHCTVWLDDTLNNSSTSFAALQTSLQKADWVKVRWFQSKCTQTVRLGSPLHVALLCIVDFMHIDTACM